MNQHTTVKVDMDRGERLREWIRAIMAKTGLSKTALAREAGVSHSLISRALDPNSAPPNFTADTILKLTQVGGIPFPDDFAAGFSDAAPGLMLSDIEPFAGEEPRAAQLLAGQSIWLVHTAQLMPVGILPGDRMILDSTVTPKNYDIVAAKVDDVTTILRVFLNDFLVTPNHIIERDRGFYHDNARVRIIGVLTESWRLRT